MTGAFWLVYCTFFFFFIVKVKRCSWVEEKESYTVSREEVISATRRNPDWLTLQMCQIFRQESFIEHRNFP